MKPKPRETRKPAQSLIALPPNLPTIQFPAKTSKCFASHLPLISLPQAPDCYTPLYVPAPVRSTANTCTRVPPTHSPTQNWIPHLPQMIHGLLPDSKLRRPTRTPPRQPVRPTPQLDMAPFTSQPVLRWFPPHSRNCQPRRLSPTSGSPLPPPSPVGGPRPVPYPRTRRAALDSRSPPFPHPSDDDLRTFPRSKYKKGI